MAFKTRSRLKTQLDSISRQVATGGRQAASGLTNLLDTGVEEIQRVDENVKYFPVDTASPFILALHDLIAGRNIVGVRTAGAMTVRLPLRAQEKQVITVTDERGKADVDPITIEVA